MIVMFCTCILLLSLSMWLYFAAERSYYYPDNILISMNPAGAVWDKMEIQKTLSI